jgi:hypothetical protein
MGNRKNRESALTAAMLGGRREVVALGRVGYCGHVAASRPCGRKGG